MGTFWGRIILARWAERLAVIFLLAACAYGAAAPSLNTLASAWHKTPNARTHAALLAFAQAHRSDQQGALALLALGAGEIDQKQLDQADAHLATAAARLPQLADYTASFRAEADWALRKDAQADALAKSVWDMQPASPVRGRMAIWSAHAYISEGQTDRALQVINEHSADLTDQQREFALAQVYDAMGRTADAIDHYDKVWFNYPLSWEAQNSEAPLEKLRGKAGGAPLAGSLILTRIAKLSAAGEYGRAARELEAYLPGMTGTDRDLASVRLAALAWEQRHYDQARDSLRSLQLPSGDADAERLYYLTAAAAHTEHWDIAQDALSRLEQSYPKSEWRVAALVAAGNRYLYSNQPAGAVPLYKTCFDEFPSDAQAPLCHWKYTWQEYIENRASAKPLFEDYLRRYPNGEKAPGALYFLARIAESAGDEPAARVYFEAIVRNYPNHYYEALARQRLADAAISHAGESAAAASFIASLNIHRQIMKPELQPAPAVQERLARAELLSTAGFDDLAQAELRFAADKQPEVVAVALADLAEKRQAPAQAIRYIKHYAPDYLDLPMEASTQRLWRLAFPLPYWDALERSAHAQGLDPYLFAALVRQESEFDTRVVSGSNAYGLSQVLPPTGRMLSRKLHVGHFRADLLFQPEVNLKIGTYYLRSLVDSLGGRWDAALASYNAGRSRVLDWMKRAQYQDSAEFVESIPITETRNYVESIFRNADIDRRLYAPQPASHS